MTDDNPVRRAAALLEQSRFLVLATSGADGPWSATLNYVVAHDSTLLFCSNPRSRHSTHITENGHISAAAFHVDAGTLDGVQLRGTCAPVPRNRLLILHEEFWSKAFPDQQEREQFIVAYEDFGHSGARDLYAITITECWVRDTHAWAQDGLDRRLPVDLSELLTYLHG